MLSSCRHTQERKSFTPASCQFRWLWRYKNSLSWNIRRKKHFSQSVILSHRNAENTIKKLQG